METVSLIHDVHPDLLLLDMRFPECSGLEVLKQLGPSSDTRVILLTAGIDKNVAIESFNSGARGILLKGEPTQMLFNGMDTVLSGQYCVYGTSASDLPDAIRKFRSANTKSGRFNLTPRELDVIQALITGRSNREIADELSITEPTVKHHVTNIFNKTGTSNRLELTLFAVEHGLLTQPPASDTGIR